MRSRPRFPSLPAGLATCKSSKGDRYRSEAVQNIRQDETLKPTRGIVYDRKHRELAVNRETWEVRLLPAELPSDPVDSAGVLDQIINALSLPDALILDPRDVPAGALETVYVRTAQLLGKTLTVEQTDRRSCIRSSARSGSGCARQWTGSPGLRLPRCDSREVRLGAHLRGWPAHRGRGRQLAGVTAVSVVQGMC